MHHVPKAFKNNAEGAVSTGEETRFLLHRDVKRKSTLEGSAPGRELTRNSLVNRVAQAIGKPANPDQRWGLFWKAFLKGNKDLALKMGVIEMKPEDKQVC